MPQILNYNPNPINTGCEGYAGPESKFQSPVFLTGEWGKLYQSPSEELLEELSDNN